jgi:alpha-glucosidase
MLHERYTRVGFNGFWNDMNEPADHASGSGTTPDELCMEDEGAWSTMHRMHNQYALLMAQATVDEGLQRLSPHDRPFVLSRAANAGMQRYAALWGGDNWSSWAHLKASIAQLINMGLSGLGFFGADVGGFNGNCQPELLARWTQLGAFYPFFRNHCAINLIHQEPWSFGPRIETICRDAIALRYHLLPYFYQLFHEMHTSGAPMVRPLFWHYQNDGNTHALNDSFLLGRYLLVAPITERGATSRMVYFPQGGWIDYYTGEKFCGPGQKLIEVPLERIGLFVREGTLLPVLDPLDSTAAVDRTQLILKVFEGEQDFDEQFYEDDTCSTAYREGNFCFNRLRYQKGRVSVELNSASAITRVSLMRRDAAAIWQRYTRDGAAPIEFVLPSR